MVSYAIFRISRLPSAMYALPSVSCDFDSVVWHACQARRRGGHFNIIRSPQQHLLSVATSYDVALVCCVPPPHPWGFSSTDLVLDVCSESFLGGLQHDTIRLSPSVAPVKARRRAPCDRAGRWYNNNASQQYTFAGARESALEGRRECACPRNASRTIQTVRTHPEPALQNPHL